MPSRSYLLDGVRDPIHYGIKIAQDIVVTHAQHTISPRLKLILPIVIVFDLPSMTVAIYLNDQGRIRANEIDDKTRDRVLTVESVTMDLTSPKPAPEEALWNS